MALAALTLVLGLAGCRQSAAPGGTTSPRRSAAPPVGARRAPASLDTRVIESAGKRFTVCRVDLSRLQLELFWRDSHGRAFGGFEPLDLWLRGRGRKLVFAMNAGMYREDLTPVGLYVENGKQLRPLNLARGRSNFCMRPNGVFAVTRTGARVVESSKYPAIRAETVLATQSGPMLVIDGRLHPAFRPQSESLYFRNGVGVVSPQQVVFAISEDLVTFYEFAVLFRDRLQCPNALYLDGSISSLYSAALRRCDKLAPLGPIIAVTAKR